MPVELVTAILPSRLNLLTLLTSLKLYRNNYTPVATSVAADFTEATFSGYSAAGLAYGSAALGAAFAEKFSGAQEFVHNGGGTANDVYGWYLVSGNQIYGARFSGAPIVMNSNGDRIAMRVNFFLYEEGDEVASDFLVNNTDELTQCASLWTSRYQVRLFAANITPTDTDTASTYSGSQATFSGYSALVPTWTAAAATVGTRAERQSDLLSWTCTTAPGSPETVYGFYILDNVSGAFVGAQKFAAPITITNIGDAIEFYLTGSVESIN